METELTSELRERASKVRIPDRILIFFLSGVGDTLMFTPALELLRKIMPRSRIVGLTMKQSEYDILDSNPDIDEVQMWKFLDKGILENLAHVFSFRARHYDLTILPCPSNRLEYNVIARICGAPRRAAFHYLKQSRRNFDFLNNFLIPHKDHVHNAEHNLQLVEKLARTSRTAYADWKGKMVLRTNFADVAIAEEYLRDHKLQGKPLVGLHISSSRAKHMERKCWPKESFLELIRRLKAIRPEFEYLIFCGNEDLEESEWLKQNAGEKVHIAKNIPIRGIAEILKRSKVLVTNDSGIMHVGIAVEAPTVAIFGPTNPKRSGPWMSPSTTVVRTDLPCSPCFYHTSSELTCPAGSDFECIRKLPVDHVLNAVLSKLDTPTK